jgi:hypothetical protein
MALRHALGLKEWRILLETHDKGHSEHIRAIKVILSQLQEAMGWTEERSILILECFTSAMGWTDIDFSQLKSSSDTKQQTTVIPTSAPKKQKGAVEPTIGSTLKFGKYYWKVLDLKYGYALLLANEVTHHGMPYNERFETVTWETCTLRKWLNSEFYYKFNPQDQAKIVIMGYKKNEKNPWFGTSGGGRTDDAIFLLSISEVVRYFKDSGQLKHKNPENECCIDDKFNEKRIANYKGKSTWWWLRSPGSSSATAAYVNSDGRLYVAGRQVSNTRSSGVVAGVVAGVRPALWLDYSGATKYN